MSNNNRNSSRGDKHGQPGRFSRGIESAFGMAMPRPRSVVPDVPASTPAFRSVQMAAPSPVSLSGSLNLRSTSNYNDVPTMPKRQQFKVDKAASLPVGSPFGSSSPFLNTFNPQFHKQDTASGVTASASSSSSSPTFQPFQWEISLIPAIPFYHPLDRSALELSISLEVLTTRVSEFFRISSISCTVQSADGRIDCVTQDLLSFVVKLWKSDDGKDEDISVASLGNDDTVDVTIEVQRRQGSSIELQSIRNCLYHAIQHGGDGKAAKRPSRAAMQLPESLMAKICASPPPPMPLRMSRAAPVPAAAAVPDSLEICSDLLSGQRADQNRLGLESLCTLTDSSQVCTETASSVSRALLVGDAAGNTPLRDAVERHLCTVSPDDEDRGLFSAAANHTLSLKVLANSLERMHSSWHDLDFSSDFWRNAVDSLKINLEHAQSRPGDASLSARSLRLLQTMEPSVCCGLATYDVQTAHNFGKAQHHMLESESKQLMDCLITSF